MKINEEGRLEMVLPFVGHGASDKMMTVEPHTCGEFIVTFDRDNVHQDIAFMTNMIHLLRNIDWDAVS